MANHNDIKNNAGIALLNVSVGGDVVQYQFVAAPDDAEARKRLHADYLRSWFTESWARVSLAEFTDRNSDASLLDIYVPLPVDFEITLQLKGKELVDWWATDEGERRMTLKEGEAAPKRRDWPSLRASENEVRKIVDDFFARKMLPSLDEDYKKEIEKGEPYESSIFMEAHDAASVQQRFVLVGEPGNGKSSFARHLTLCLAGQLRLDGGESAHAAPELAKANLAALRDWILGAYTPIYIELRDVVARAFPGKMDDKPTLATFWRYVDECILAPRMLRPFAEVLLKQLQTGETLIVLDGLDEVSQADDPRRREQIKSFVRALTQYPARIIVTSRPHAYRGDWDLDGFGRAELRPLSLDRLHELAQNLFAALEDDAEAEVRRFIGAVAQIPDEQARNPLFFTLLAAIWQRQPKGQRRLPASEGEVYRQSLDLMLAKWTQRKGVTKSVTEELGLSEGQLRTALQMLACQVHENDQPGQDSTLFHGRVVADVLYDVANVRPKDVLGYLEQRAGILVSPAPNQFRFAHRSFQEHLAACELTHPTDETREPAILTECAFPDGLAQRVLAQPDVWRNVALHASDRLARARMDELWALLPKLYEPFMEGASEQAPAQAALLALELAARHTLLTPTRKKRSVDGLILEELTQVALKALRDDRLVTKQRGQAGDWLAQLGDPRREVVDVDGIELKPIPAGTFWMGSADDDDPSFADEKPRHEQTIPRDFGLARYPITNAQFNQFVLDDGYLEAVWWGHAGSYWQAGQGFKGPYDNDFRRKPHRYDDARLAVDNHPVVGVSWYEAVAFCKWLTARWRGQGRMDAQQEVRLPTEAEWERAARGKQGEGPYPWAGALTPEHANYSATRLGATNTVGCFPLGVGNFGCEEMIGNVWEWTGSLYGRWEDKEQKYIDLFEYPYGPDDGRENSAAGNEWGRVLRGGSWSTSPLGARCASRNGGLPGNLWNEDGFRVAVSPFFLKPL